jgi:hypothetical protein
MIANYELANWLELSLIMLDKMLSDLMIINDSWYDLSLFKIKLYTSFDYTHTSFDYMHNIFDYTHTSFDYTHTSFDYTHTSFDYTHTSNLILK